MIYPVYAYRDIKGSFSQPYCEQHEAAAFRGFAYMINQPGMMSFSPADFDLFQIGTYDSESGVLVALTPIKFIVNGQSVFGDQYEK